MHINKRLKIIHLVPTSYGGGVEAAAKSFLNYSSDYIKFEVIFINKKRSNKNFLDIYYKSLKKIKKNNPNLIITSLWKSNLLTLLYKFFCKFDTKIILFLHSTNNKHFIDGLITTFCALFAYEIWADSEETLRTRLKSLYLISFYKDYLIKKNSKRIVSFILKKIKPLKYRTFKNSFIYWGRLCPKKNIDKSLKLFSKIFALDTSATFYIIGPDYGAKKIIYKMIDRLGIKNNVFVFDFMRFNEVKKLAKKARFFIQLSSFEGMAMSVTESMQLGLIPLVTNVGQIKNYCKDSYNCLIYNKNDDEIIDYLVELSNSEEKYNFLRKNIIKTWSKYPTYTEDMISSLQRLRQNN